MRTIHRRIASAYIVSQDGKILFGRKQPGSGAVYEDCWHIPGGGVDEGETDKQALAREILEETDIDISSATIILVDDVGTDEREKTLHDGEKVLAQMQFNIFKVEIDKRSDDVNLVEADDLINFRWFDLDELKTIKLTPPAYATFERIGMDWLRT